MTDLWYVVFATNTDTQKHDTDEKEFAEISEKDNHLSDKTNKCSNESRYANCGEGHMTGSNDCEMEQNEGANK